MKIEIEINENTADTIINCLCDESVSIATVLNSMNPLKRSDLDDLIMDILNDSIEIRVNGFQVNS